MFFQELRLLDCQCDFPALDDALLDQFMFSQTDQWLKHKLASIKDMLTRATTTKQSPLDGHLPMLAKAKGFGKLYLSQAYQQLPVDEAIADAQTIVTHLCAFRV